MINAYGPTEATVTCTLSEPLTGERAPIGRAVTNTRIYILEDDCLEPVPEGMVGSLYVAGHCLAGYQGRAALTAARFVPPIHLPVTARACIRLVISPGERRSGAASVRGQSGHSNEATRTSSGTGRD